MKKILLLLGVAVLSMSLNATPVTSVKKFAKPGVQAAVKAPSAEFSALKAPKANAPKAKAATDTIKIVGIRSLAYYTTQFVFKCKPAKSTFYNFDICETESGKYKFIATGAWKKAALDTINERQGYYAFQSMWVINYGINGTNISEATDNEDVINSFKEQWDKYVVAFDQDEDDGSYYYCLKPGKYAFFVEGLDAQYATTEEYAGKLFEVKWYSVSDINAEISLDNTKATLSWKNPEDLFEGAQTYIAVYDNEGELAYTNHDKANDSIIAVTSPVTFDVEEGKTYTAVIELLTADRHQAGLEEEYIFTVGPNPYAPKNLAAEVIAEEGDSVHFSWTSETQPYAFGVEIYYKSGEYFAKLGYEEGDRVAGGRVQAYQIGAHLPPGTYTWAVIAYTYDGQYISYASEYIQGPEFTTVDLGAPIITGYSVETAEGSQNVTITFEVDDNYYTVDEMKFYVSGDITGEWTTTNGAYTITGLEVGKEYTIEVVVEDPAGNINEFATTEITFVAGKAQEEAIDQVIFDIKANKVLHEGQLIIKRDNKAFNVLGAEL